MNSPEVRNRKFKQRQQQQLESFPRLTRATQAQEALKHGYEAQQKVFKALDTAAQNNPKITGPGGSTGFALLHKTWYERYFEEFADNIQTFYKAKLDKEITSWAGGSGAYGLYQSIQRNKISKSKTPLFVLSC